MVSSLRERAARIPDAAWLTGIVSLSVLVRLWLVNKMPGPYIFVDELIYSELATNEFPNEQAVIKQIGALLSK